VSEIDDYLEGVDPTARAALEHIRGVVKTMVPDAEEGRSYGMPAFKYQKRPLIGFIAAQDHLSVFPFSPRVIDEVRDELCDFQLSKGTIRFSAEHLIPDDVLRRLVDVRLAELNG
jgi:uncharacterized protein YdhG (YjbR/CyaY superfamily)